MFKYPCNFKSFLRFPRVLVIRYRFSSLNLFTLVTPKQFKNTFIFFLIVNHLRWVQSLNLIMCLSKIFMGQKKFGLISLVNVFKELLFFQLCVATTSKFFRIFFLNYGYFIMFSLLFKVFVVFCSRHCVT